MLHDETHVDIIYIDIQWMLRYISYNLIEDKNVCEIQSLKFVVNSSEAFSIFISESVLLI